MVTGDDYTVYRLYKYPFVYEHEDYKLNEILKRLIQQDRIDRVHSALSTGKPINKSKNIVNRPRDKLNSTRLCRVKAVDQ